MTTLDVNIGQLRSAVAPLSDRRGPARQHRSSPRDADPRDRAARRWRSSRWPARAFASPATGRSARHDAAAPRCRSIPSRPARRAAAVGQPRAGARAARGGARRRSWRRSRRSRRPPSHGLVVQLRGGPSVYFGDDTELRARNGLRPWRCSPTRARPGPPTSTSPIRRARPPAERRGAARRPRLQQAADGTTHRVGGRLTLNHSLTPCADRATLGRRSRVGRDLQRTLRARVSALTCRIVST